MVKIKFLLIFSLMVFTGAQAGAFRPYAKGTEAKTSWMTVSSLKTGQQYYMEVAADGTVVTRTETRNIITTRRGKISPQLAKDFFREIESCDLIISQSSIDNKLVFYKGELLGISAYISGELKRITAPLNNFGEAFAHAFGEVKKAADKLPEEKTLKGFLTAEPLAGAELEALQSKAAKEGELKTVETYDIQKIDPLLKAIKQPYRLIPLETAAQVKELRTFISARQLYGLRKLFYLPSTRGTFKCQLLDAAK
ncbi:MAG: hypothetical protein WCW52_00850 [Elusimicrobiales bacterium]|jgi:hypothetical protein